MACDKKKKTDAKPSPGRYQCKDCGAVVKKKKSVCDPKRVKK